MLNYMLIKAYLKGSIRSPRISLDSLLLWALAEREHLPPITMQSIEERKQNLEKLSSLMPLHLKNGVWAASESIYEEELTSYEAGYINKRFPCTEAAFYGVKKLKQISLKSKLSKSYRIPISQAHLKNDTMFWFAQGNPSEIEKLLQGVFFLGKKRSIGSGEISTIEVTTLKNIQDEHFPLLANGVPLRPLPLSYESVAKGFKHDYRVLTPPYWEKFREEICLVRSEETALELGAYLQ